MTDIEIPLGKRSKLYRAFEILPGALSIAAVVLLIVLFFISPLAASIYVLIVVGITFIRSASDSITSALVAAASSLSILYPRTSILWLLIPYGVQVTSVQ